jgi:hypothetical protein
MRSKLILAISSSVIIVNFFLILIRWSDSPLDFIPFLEIFTERKLKIYAYDLFLAGTVMIFLLLFKRYSINLSVIKSIPSLFYPISRMDIGIAIGTGISSYFFVSPFLFQFLSDPILKLCRYTHDSIRHTVMMALIFVLLFILSILSKNSSAGAYYPVPPGQAPTMPPPPPPTW